MSATQLSFSLRVSSGVKTVHMLGSWDGYKSQLPLSKDKHASKPGSWKGTFRFQSTTLEPGQRYWYYYIIDGYHVAHNPSMPSTVEPTTGRELNILDVGSDGSHSSSKKSSSKHSSSAKHSSSGHKERSSRHRASLSVDVAKGRPLSVSQIQCPKPMSPRTPKHILNSDYDNMDDLAARFGAAGIDGDDFVTEFGNSPSPSSTGSSLSYRSDSSSPDSSLSGYSTPGSEYSACTCERYGITRKGDRVKIDCGGARCGYDNESECSSQASEYESDYEPVAPSRRHGVVVRH